jgi:hypothetical protein
MMSEKELLIESRFDRTEYLLESNGYDSTADSTAGHLRNTEPIERLLWELVNTMSDREFHGVYKHICRCRDIEPDLDKA